MRNDTWGAETEWKVIVHDDQHVLLSFCMSLSAKVQSGLLCPFLQDNLVNAVAAWAATWVSYANHALPKNAKCFVQCWFNASLDASLNLSMIQCLDESMLRSMLLWMILSTLGFVNVGGSMP